MYRLSASVESSSFGLFVCLFAWKVETSKMSNRSESKTRGYLLHYYYSHSLWRLPVGRRLGAGLTENIRRLCDAKCNKFQFLIKTLISQVFPINLRAQLISVHYNLRFETSNLSTWFITNFKNSKIFFPAKKIRLWKWKPEINAGPLYKQNIIKFLLSLEL